MDSFVNTEDTTMPENNLLIENEFRHVKVFRFPTGKSFPKNLIFVTLTGILTLLIICGFVFWAAVSTFSKIDRERVVANPEAISRKPSLLGYFRRISGPQTISGIYVYKVGTNSNASVEIVQSITGVSPGLISTKMPKYDSNETMWNSFIDEVICNWKNQHLVRGLWAPAENPLLMMKSFAETRYVYEEPTLKELIKEGSELNKLWKEQMDKIAPYFQKLQNAGVITILDILSTMNNDKYYWSGRPGVNGSMELYKISHDYLSKVHNLSSLIWMWSLWSKNMTRFEDFWPERDYVDVVAVHMGVRTELPIHEYQRLINLVGDTPIGMEFMVTVPTVQLLAAQPRWTWFTARDDFLQSRYNTASNLRATFNYTSVINQGNIDFFNENH